MFRFDLALVALCCTLTAGPVAAQAVVGPEAAVLPLSASRFSDMRGEYRMSDGSILAIEGVRLQPTARLGEDAPVALRAAGPDRLVSIDGRWQLVFRSRADRFDAVVLTRLVAAH